MSDPWAVNPARPYHVVAGGELVADCAAGGANRDVASVNAALIVSRVNAHDDLLAALLETRMGDDADDGLPCWCPSPTLARARRAEGKEPHRPLCNLCRAALAKANGGAR